MIKVNPLGVILLIGIPLSVFLITGSSSAAGWSLAIWLVFVTLLSLGD